MEEEIVVNGYIEGNAVEQHICSQEEVLCLIEVRDEHFVQLGALVHEDVGSDARRGDERIAAALQLEGQFVGHEQLNDSVGGNDGKNAITGHLHVEVLPSRREQLNGSVVAQCRGNQL